MRRALPVMVAAAVLGLTGCSGDGDGGSGDSGGAAGDHDQEAYCSLVEDALTRTTADPAGLDGEITPESAKAIEEAFSAELAFMQEVAAAAPDELADEWQSVVDVQAGVAEQGRKFLDPEFVAEFEAKSQQDRAEFLLSEVLGGFEDLDEEDLDAIAEHAEAECGVEGLFGT